MAQRTLIVLEDDLDGGEATETVTFALDGGFYEIDLSGENAARMRDVLSPYIGAGRRATATRPSGRPARTASRRGTSSGTEGLASQDPKAVRSWAEANGVTVNARGRLSASVLAQYQAAVGR